MRWVGPGQTLHNGRNELLLRNQCYDKIKYNQQDQYGVHNEIYPNVRFVLLIECFEFFEHAVKIRTFVRLHPVSGRPARGWHSGR